MWPTASFIIIIFFGGGGWPGRVGFLSPAAATHFVRIQWRVRNSRERHTQFEMTRNRFDSSRPRQESLSISHIYNKNWKQIGNTRHKYELSTVEVQTSACKETLGQIWFRGELYSFIVDNVTFFGEVENPRNEWIEAKRSDNFREKSADVTQRIYEWKTLSTAINAHLLLARESDLDTTINKKSIPRESERYFFRLFLFSTHASCYLISLFSLLRS